MYINLSNLIYHFLSFETISNIHFLFKKVGYKPLPPCGFTRFNQENCG